MHLVTQFLFYTCAAICGGATLPSSESKTLTKFYFADGENRAGDYSSR